MSTSELIFLLIWGLLVVFLIFLFLPIRRTRTKANTSLDYENTDTFLCDDDQYWYGDFFYNNPDDPAVFVPKRFGFGWTVNFGNPKGKLFMIAALLLPLLIALLGIIFPGMPSYGCHPSGCHPFP